ncbi:MAG: AI-2E family transporter [Kiritimatiellales bacterium]
MQQNQRVLIPLIGIIALVAAGFVLKTAQAVILPLVIAWFLSYILAPLVNFLARHKVPTGPSVGVVLILLLGFFYLTGLFVYSRAMAFADEYPKYADQFNQIAASFTDRVTMPSWISFNTIDWQQKVGEWFVSLPGSFVVFFKNLLLVLIFLVFMLLGKPYFQNKIERAFPDSQGEKVNRVTVSIASQISRYLYIKLLLSLMTGALVWLVLRLMGVDFPITWAVLAFLLNFIPTVGSIVATIPPVLLALVQFYPNLWMAAAVLFALLIIHQTIGSFIEPKLMGENLNLSPVVILLSLVFWGWLWGITGALLSVPIAAAVKIVCENIEMLKPISVLMGSGKHYHKHG